MCTHNFLTGFIMSLTVSCGLNFHFSFNHRTMLAENRQALQSPVHQFALQVLVLSPTPFGLMAVG